MRNQAKRVLLWLIMVPLQHFIIRPAKALGKGLQVFSAELGTPAPGLLINTWASNQTVDAPGSSGTQSVAAAGTAALNAESGVITLTGFTAAAGAMQTATITNNKIVATSNIIATLNNYAGTYGTNGEPILMAVTVAAGSMVLRIGNIHGANALSGDITVSFRVGQRVI